MPQNDLIVDVIEGLAEADGMEPTELEYSLSEYMDPEVLARLGDLEDGTWELTFQVSDHHVRITHGGTIFINGMKYVADSAPRR